MMGSTGGPQTAKNDDDKLTIDNLWKILASEKNINETVGRMSREQDKANSRSRSRNAAERGYEQRVND